MQIKKVVIKHFRSIKKLEVDLSPSVIFAGPNSCGKSNVLRAIRFAFVPEYDPLRVAANFPVFINGPAAEINIALTFDFPSNALVSSLGVPAGQPFAYEVAVARNGKAKYKVAGIKVTETARSVLLAEFQIVYVPPIRDISSGGLAPLKGLLARALRNAKKGLSVSSLNQTISRALVTKGSEVLNRADRSFGSISSVGSLAVNTALVDSGFALEQLGLEVNLVGSGRVPLDALGTGHQSQVVMNLFGSLGASLQGQILYMFEEPDNHLHPTALIAVAEQMRSVANTGVAQIFVSSHSPSFIGSFPITNVIVLDCISGVTGQRKRLPVGSSRRMHALLARFGLKPIEALLARAVMLVEGPSDVSLIRGISAEWHKTSPEQRDVLIVPCGGKTQIIELYSELLKLGIACFVMFDGDAALGGSPAYLSQSASKSVVAPAITNLLAAMNPSAKKIIKSLHSIERELTHGAPPGQSFSNSPVEVVVKASGKVNAVDQSKIGSALLKGRRTVWRAPLANANIWVWKSDPEDVLSVIPNCVSIINNALAGLTSAPTALALGTPASTVRGWLHNNASEPEVHETVVSALVRSSKKSGELWDFAKFLAAILSPG